MASSSNTMEALNAAVSSANAPPYHSHQKKWWKGCWSGLWCFGSERRVTRIVPASPSGGGGGRGVGGGGGWVVNGGPSSQPVVVALAPPSSPASFVNSSVQSPASFNLSLSVSANLCSLGPPNPMFAIGPYLYETQLVSPPVFSSAFSSAFTTEPSTAPLTPPPELAYAAMPAGVFPDVPFAQLLASSLEAKGEGGEGGEGGGEDSHLLHYMYQLYPLPSAFPEHTECTLLEPPLGSHTMAWNGGAAGGNLTVSDNNNNNKSGEEEGEEEEEEPNNAWNQTLERGKRDASLSF